MSDPSTPFANLLRRTATPTPLGATTLCGERPLHPLHRPLIEPHVALRAPHRLMSIDASPLVGALSGPRDAADRLYAFIDQGHRLRLSAVVLYQWLRGRAP